MTPKPVPELIGGPYHAPACRPSDWLDCEIAGRVEVGGWSRARMPWPRRRKTGRHSLILCGDLVRAVCLESSEAVQHWWGVGDTTVWAWRQALGVGRITDGTRLLLKDRTGVPPKDAARGRTAAMSPGAVERGAAKRRGQPAHPNTRAALLEAASRPKPAGWGARANAWMTKAKRPAN